MKKKKEMEHFKEMLLNYSHPVELFMHQKGLDKKSK